MKYPCGIIRDMLPLYIDEACSPETKAAVEDHLPQCPRCKQCYETMKNPDSYADGAYRDAEDTAMADGLKKVKKSINNKQKRILWGAAAAVVLCLLGFYLLFVAPLKELSPEDISISATVYAIDELPMEVCVDENALTIFADEGDTSPAYTITIPAIPGSKVSLTEKLMGKHEYISVISYTCAYNIRETEISAPLTLEGEPNTLYIESARTTLLNNKAAAGMQQTSSLQFGKTNKIIFVEDDGTETVLWENDTIE